jgi:hypothetical protein
MHTPINPTPKLNPDLNPLNPLNRCFCHNYLHTRIPATRSTVKLLPLPVRKSENENKKFLYPNPSDPLNGEAAALS